MKMVWQDAQTHYVGVVWQEAQTHQDVAKQSKAHKLTNTKTHDNAAAYICAPIEAHTIYKASSNTFASGLARHKDSRGSGLAKRADSQTLRCIIIWQDAQTEEDAVKHRPNSKMAASQTPRHIKMTTSQTPRHIESRLECIRISAYANSNTCACACGLARSTDSPRSNQARRTDAQTLKHMNNTKTHTGQTEIHIRLHTPAQTHAQVVWQGAQTHGEVAWQDA